MYLLLIVNKNMQRNIWLYGVNKCNVLYPIISLYGCLLSSDTKFNAAT